jgi:hypothetical protein
MNFTNTPSPQEFNPSMPQTLLWDNLERSYSRQIRQNLDQRNVVIQNDVMRRFDSQINGLTRELYRQARYTAEQATRSAEVFSEEATVNVDARNRQIHEQIEQQMATHLETIAMTIAHKALATNPRSTDRRGHTIALISEQNIDQISLTIQSLSYVLNDNNTLQILNSVAAQPEGLDSRTSEQVFNLLASTPQNSLQTATRAFAQQIINQGLSAMPAGMDSVLRTAAVLNQLNQSQKLVLVDYSLAQVAINPGNTAKVILELVRSGGISAAAVNARIQAAISDSTDTQTTNFLTSLMARTETVQAQAVQSNARLLRDIDTATFIASRDITNPATQTGRWLATGGVMASAFVGGIGVLASLLSGNIPAAIGSVITPLAVGSVAFDAAAGNSPLTLPRRVASRFAIGREGRERIALGQWKNRLKALTLVQDKEVTEFFASDFVILTLRNSVDPNASEDSFDLNRFENHLRNTSPDLYQVYFNNYAKNFDQNRSQLAQNLLEVGLGYHMVQIHNYQQYIDEIATPNGANSTQITNLG